jgi:hypothetical protein
VSLLRRAPATPDSPEQRAEKLALRQQRTARAKEARAATSAMASPEPQAGLYVAAFMLAVGLVSFLGQDVIEKAEKVHGKTKDVLVAASPHPANAAILIVFTLAAAASIYWRRRLVTGIFFIFTALVGFGVPLPRSIQDGTWLAFMIPAGYVLWMLIFRMNKEQKEWIAANTPARGGTGPARNTSRRSSKNAPVAGARSRRSGGAPTTTSAGRPSPSGSGRYTPPRAKPRAGQRKS